MKTLLLSSVLLLAFLVSAPALTNKVLIIGIDGTMPSAMAVARTPNLNSLKSNGCYSVRAVTHPVTHSAACWSSMFTGVWGDKHLVNDPNNSFTGNNLAQYPSFFKRLEAFNPNLNTICLARWSPLLTVVPDADVKLAFSTDAEVTAETCRRLTNSNPDVFYMILLDVDSAGHSYGWGPTVSNYVSAIETADTRVGQILAALRARATYNDENWLVISLTDHGEHDNPDPEKSRITWHIVSGPSAARGVMWPSPSTVDVCATVFTHMGVPIDPAWNLDARVEGLPLRPTAYGANLIFNGDAEANSGSGIYATNRGTAWWFDITGATLGAYGNNPLFPSLASPGPENRGSNFFLGGTGASWMTQRIDVSDFSGQIDAASPLYEVSGWFGGLGSEADAATLTATFLSTNSLILGKVSVGNPTPLERAGQTALLFRSTSGQLPSGTRFIEFGLTNSVATGNNDASADNLSFVLWPAPVPPFSIESISQTSDQFQVGLTALSGCTYVLERSDELTNWVVIDRALSPAEGPFTLQDTNPPATYSFYRVGCSRNLNSSTKP